MMKYNFFLIWLLISLSAVGYAQFPEDALRFSTPGVGVGARSLGLGMAYTGIANDFSATYWNPAGLGQIRMSEVSLGLSNVSYGNTGTLFGTSKSFTNSATSLNNFGLVYPFPTVRGSLVVAIGYNRQSDFTTGLSFKGFNPRSSIIQTWAPNGQPYPSDLSDNVAYQLYLANIDTVERRFVSLIDDSVMQSGKVLEGGGLNNVSLSGAVEAARNFFIGGTISFLTGTYSYTRNYYEDDIKNVYNRLPFDFESLSLLETIESDLSGFTMKMGILYRFNPQGRFGLAIKTPSWVTVREKFSLEASSTFDNRDKYTFPLGGANPRRNEYDVVTPFVFTCGFSYSIDDFMFAGEIEYTDWTQMEFRDAEARLLSYNTDIKEIYQPTANLKVGGEYEIRDVNLRLRSGFAYLPSPYKGDPFSFAQKYVTAGLGFVVENSIAIDLGYAYGFRDSFRYNYDSTSKTNEEIRTNNFIATVSYRF